MNERNTKAKTRLKFVGVFIFARGYFGSKQNECLIFKIFEKMRIFLIFIFGFTMAEVHASQKDSKAKVVNAINGFSLGLYKKLRENDNNNLVCSGYSAHCVLNLLIAGARGLTFEEVNRTLGYEDFNVSIEDIPRAFQEILTIEKSNRKGYDLDVANSVWIKSGENLDADFTANLERTFGIEERQVDFTNSSAATEEINKWVGQKTKGRIPSLFDSALSKDTLLVLVNAIYFKGTWNHPFNKNLSVQEDFISGSNSRKVLMMKTSKRFRYADSEDLDAQVLELPYEGHNVSMIILLPKTNDGLAALENQLTSKNLDETLKNMFFSEVHVTLPKFKISSKLPLNTILQSLGIVKAFKPGEADLSGINGKNNLYVSDSIQKADIEVNEEGTVATAATAIAVNTYAAIHPPPKEILFVANHPFFFILKQKGTGIILFCGRVTDPQT